MNSDPFDLLIHAGRIVCPQTGRDRPGRVGVSGQTIAAIDPPDDSPARRTLAFPDALLLPGLLDELADG